MSYSHNRLYVIIPAAGSGSRMHSDKNKLFMEVDGISVIDRTMAAFRRFADEYGVDIEAILVISPDAASTWGEYVKGKSDYGMVKAFAKGGATRTESVGNGVRTLKDLHPENKDPVFIHDGARCLIDSDSLGRCFSAICEDGIDVCVSGVATKNTIKVVRSHEDKEPVIVDHTPLRSNLYEVQTPQCFKFGTLEEIYDRASRDGIEATDDTALAEILGYEVRIIEGSYSNIKITTPEDIAIAEALLKT